MTSNAVLTSMLHMSMQLKFTHLLPLGCLDVLNLKASTKLRGCPSCHCEESVNSHGYTRGYLGLSHEREVRRVRFFAQTEALT